MSFSTRVADAVFLAFGAGAFLAGCGQVPPPPSPSVLPSPQPLVSPSPHASATPFQGEGSQGASAELIRGNRLSPEERQVVARLQEQFGFLSRLDVVRVIQSIARPDGTTDATLVEAYESDRASREETSRGASRAVARCPLPPDVKRYWDIEHKIKKVSMLRGTRKFQMEQLVASADTVEPEERTRHTQFRAMIAADLVDLEEELDELERERKLGQPVSAPACASRQVPTEEVHPGHFRSQAWAKAERHLQEKGDVVDPRVVAETEAVLRGMDMGIAFAELARIVIQYEDVERDARLCRFLRAAAPGSPEAALLRRLARPQRFPYMLAQ